MNIRLERINPDANRYRYYLVSLSPTLWGNWGVACRWGRIGESYRGERLCECAGQDEALYLVAVAVERRMRRGYVVIGVV